MTKHYKQYIEYHGYYPGEQIYCKVCSAPAVDIHHIVFRSKAHKNYVNHISNLIALCRSCHDKAHDYRLLPEYLHQLNLEDLKNKHQITINVIKHGKDYNI